MKRATLVIAVLLLALARPAQANFVQTFNTGFQNGGVIPDGSLTGWSDTRTLSGAAGRHHRRERDAEPERGLERGSVCVSGA